jgi:hypothetical protein
MNPPWEQLSRIYAKCRRRQDRRTARHFPMSPDQDDLNALTPANWNPAP